jgi:hypothetical protein
VNLAKFQPVTVDSTNGQFLASYLTDGVAGNENRWQSNGSGPHWARVDFPFPIEVGSAQVFTGFDDINAQANFKIQYLKGSSWVDAPGAVVTGNTNIERNIVFTTPVTTSKVRLEFTNPGTTSVRELCIFPANNGNTGYPPGSGVTGAPPSTANGRRLDLEALPDLAGQLPGASSAGLQRARWQQPVGKLAGYGKHRRGGFQPHALDGEGRRALATPAVDGSPSRQPGTRQHEQRLAGGSLYQGQRPWLPGGLYRASKLTTSPPSANFIRSGTAMRR